MKTAKALIKVNVFALFAVVALSACSPTQFGSTASTQTMKAGSPQVDVDVDQDDDGNVVAVCPTKADRDLSKAVAGANCKKVTICHVPPGNPANAHTITIGASAVKPHLDHHADYLGPCRAVPDEEACVPDEDPMPMPTPAPSPTATPPPSDPNL